MVDTTDKDIVVMKVIKSKNILPLLLRMKFLVYIVALLIAMVIFTVELTAFEKDSANATKWVLPNREVYRPKVALVLSGGGSRGLAQIGVLHELEKAGIPIDYIIGSSIGAIVGGLYASGYTAHELDSILTKVEWERILALGNEQDRTDLFLDQKFENDRNLVTLRFRNFKLVVPQSISGGTRLALLLQELVWNGIYHADGDFNNLKVPFRAVATDLVKGRAVALGNGDLVNAMRASATVPLRYTPIRIDSMVLVDGGIMSNIPVEMAVSEFHPSIIIAVNTTSPLLEAEDLDTPWNVADQVITSMMNMQYERFGNSISGIPVVSITPELGRWKNTDFSEIKKLISLGEKAGIDVINQIKKILSEKEDSIITVKYCTPYFPSDMRTVRLEMAGHPTPPLYADVSAHPASESVTAIETPISAIRKIRNLSVDENYEHTELSLFHGIVQSKGFVYAPIQSVHISVDSSAKLSVLNTVASPNIYSPQAVRLFSEKLIKGYRNSGYSFAQLNTLKFIVTKGDLRGNMNQALLRNVVVHGNKTVPNVVITREFEPLQFEPLQSKKLLQICENLWNTSYFSAVELVPNYTDSGNVDLHVLLKEQPNQMLRIGTRIDNERNIQVGLDLIHEHPLGIDFRVYGRIIGSARIQSISLGMDAPRLFDSFWSADIQGFSSTTNMYYYSRRVGLPKDKFEYIREGDLALERNGIHALFGRQIERKGKFYTQFRYEYQRIHSIGDTNSLPKFQSLTSLKFATRFDTQDRADLPTSGRVLDMSVESTILNPPDAVNFSKVEFLYKTTLSVSVHSFTPSLHFGFGDKSMPLTEQFSIGGEDSFYGKREDEERGQQIAAGSLEYRLRFPLRIFFDTYIAARYDIGSVWENFSTIKFSGLKHGLGLSLTLDTPLGLAKVSIGQSIFFTDKPGIVRAPALGYFSIGARL